MIYLFILTSCKLKLTSTCTGTAHRRKLTILQITIHVHASNDQLHVDDRANCDLSREGAQAHASIDATLASQQIHARFGGSVPV